MTLRAFLVDDEPLALERLRRLLAQTGRVDVVGATTIPEDAVAALNADTPDICFLDIQMPRLTGFDVLARLPRQPVVVFTTAYDQYALKAFGVNSVDYLLKPVEPEALACALDKVERLRVSAPVALPDLDAILRQIAGALRASQPECPARIASRLGNRLCFLDLDRVTHFYAQDKLTWAVSEGKSYCIDASITQLEKKLNPKQFARIHRATLVNLSWIREVTPFLGGSLSLRLKDAKGTGITVARDRAHAFRSRVGL
jgi:two-component system, LytTR family, response regulator